ncbi:MAG: hypothetical protein GF311_08805 [Candidatus Lokiarchaeota archaeon]|nr:hypothetical protein [Candidatus Lokiarchaeota archaeon]
MKVQNSDAIKEENVAHPQKVVFICGAPHSGSTLLGLILGSHTRCFYAGEANKVKFLRKNNEHPDKYCKICGPSCEIWGDFVYNKDLNIYPILSKKTGKEIVIDSTKKLEWVKIQLDKLTNTPSEKYLIYLLRDGRAVINSRLRKYKETHPEEIIEEWIRHMEKTNYFYQGFNGPKIQLHYEELATEPVKAIRSLCQFLGIIYEDAMLRYYNHQHHPLGGNTGTQSLIIKAQEENIENQYIQLSERNKYYYSDHPLSIKLDLRWVKELDSDVIELFERKAGEINLPMKWKEK